MQEPTPQPPAVPAPLPPAAAAAGTEAQTVAPAPFPGVPQTPQEVAALRSVRRELSNQITSAASRREELADQLKTADAAARPGLEARIAILDQRIVQLESDIASTGRLLTSSPAGWVSSTSPAQMIGGMPPEGVVAIGVLFTLFVMAPIAFAAARLMWKRARMPARPAQPPETTQRLERIEQSVEAVAIEVERVTEGQRFLTKLLTEAKAPRVLAGPAAGD